MIDLTRADTHFEFGKNWKSFSSGVSGAEIDQAIAGLKRLLQLDSLAGKGFLDIGCGSGIHALAALEMGASEVLAVDIDPDSVESTQAMLSRHASTERTRVELASVFELDATALRRFDIVYSWGVLHHTGRMEEAIRRAAALVADGGLFAFALYHKTWLCWAWRLEKRWYTGASERWRRVARRVYVGMVRVGLLATGRDFAEYRQSYVKNRGMDFEHDVHDWLGGYPYESASPAYVSRLMHSLGFIDVSSLVRAGVVARSGVLGSGCDEYLYRRVAPSHASTAHDKR